MIVIFTNLSSVAPPRSLSLASYGTSANNISVKVIYNLNPTNINVSHFNIILNCEGILPSSSVSSVPMSRGNLCFISQLFNFSFSSLDISLAITVVLINFEEHKFNHTISIYKLCFYPRLVIDIMEVVGNTKDQWTVLIEDRNFELDACETF